MNNFNEENSFNGSFGVNFTNFDPSNLTVDEVIGITFVIDKSGSVSRYVSDMNDALNDFLHTMQKSHHSSKMLVQIIEFNDKVTILNGYQPIIDVKDFSINPSGMTALNDAIYFGLKNTMDYKEQLEQQGITFKAITFCISDGEDNSSSKSSNEVKKFVEDVYAEEKNFGEFQIIFFGVGNPSIFNGIASDLGIKLVTTVGTTGVEMRKMVSIISSSVSSSASGNNSGNITF